MTEKDGAGTLRDQAKAKSGNRLITKAVLASPLIIPWPNLPRNYQTAVMQELPKLVPDTVAAYHTARSRCHGERKKAARKLARQEKAKQSDQAMDAEGGERPEIQAGPSAKVEEGVEVPTKPEILDHLVLGINETIKSLERAIDDLRLRLLLMADRLNGIHLKPGTKLLPTAPRSASRSPSPPPHTAAADVTEISPPAFVIIPLHSISPQSLVSPIPQYAATYDSLVWQWTQLSKIVKMRLKEAEWAEVLGSEKEEVKVVPLGRVEGEMAALVGLRRLACLAIRRSHPHRELLEKILPRSILHPPRHALTLPYPQSDLKVHTGTSGSASVAPQPHVHYAPLSIKGITTSTPVDATSRKKQRLAEVRQKRVAAKAKRKMEREGGGKAGKKPKAGQKGKSGGVSASKS